MPKARKPSAPTTPIILATEGDGFRSLGAEAERAGQPVERFRKDVLHAGRLSHPADGWTEDFTPDRLRKIADETRRLIANGHEPHVPAGHVRYADAETNRGWVKSLDVEGDRLFAELELVGADAIKEAARNKVSVFIEPQFQDGKGNKYGEVITHIALTPMPVQTGQDAFVAIAASAEGKDTINVPVAKLAAEPDESKDKAMSLIEMIAKLTGKQVADEAAAAAALEEWANSMQAMKADAAKAASLAKENEALKAKAEGKQVEKPSAMVLKLARENREMKLNALVQDGKITPAVRDRLSATWAAKDSDALALSMDDTSDKRFDEMIAALGENDPVKLGEQTKKQTLAASHDPHKGGDEPRVDPDIEKRSARLTGKK